MDPISVIIAKRRGGKLEILSNPSESSNETEQNFMPFRLTRTHYDFEWAALLSTNLERLERFDAPVAPAGSDSSKKAKK